MALPVLPTAALAVAELAAYFIGGIFRYNSADESRKKLAKTQRNLLIEKTHKEETQLKEQFDFRRAKAISQGLNIAENEALFNYLETKESNNLTYAQWDRWDESEAAIASDRKIMEDSFFSSLLTGLPTKAISKTISSNKYSGETEDTTNAINPSSKTNDIGKDDETQYIQPGKK